MANPVLSGFKAATAILGKFFVKNSSGTEIAVYDTDGYLYQNGTKITKTAAQLNAGTIAFYQRVTTAEVNSGLALLTPSATGQYRLMDIKLRAIGGNASAATSVEITEETSGAIFFQAPVANLTQNVTIGVDAANIVDTNLGIASVAGKKILIGKTGSSLATATHIDVLMIYSIAAT